MSQCQLGNIKISITEINNFGLDGYNSDIDLYYKIQGYLIELNKYKKDSGDYKIYREEIKNSRRLLRLRSPSKYAITFEDIKRNYISEFTVDIYYRREKLSKKLYELLKTFKLECLKQDIQPASKKHYVGLELEFCSKIDIDKLSDMLYPFEYVQLKNDGSLRPKKQEIGYEIALLLEEGKLTQQLKPIMDVLTKIGAKVENRRCGLHVHLDVRRRNKDVVFHNLVSCQSLLYKITNPERRFNEFCRPVKSKKFPKKFNGSREERYKTINAAAYYRHKTIEVRLHEGSVDFDVINTWIKLLIKICNYPKKLQRSISGLTTLNKYVKLNSRLVNKLQDRECYWQINAPRTSNRTSPLTESIEFPVTRPTNPDSLFVTQETLTAYNSLYVNPDTTNDEDEVL